MRIFYLITFFLLLNFLTAQEVSLDSILSDSITVKDSVSLSDSLSLSDSTAVQDSLTKKKKTDIEAVVYASSSDSLTFDVLQKKMNVYGNGNLKYKQSELTSGNIFVDFTTNELFATGIPDTSAQSDSTESKIIQTPVLKEEGETYEGFNIRYNFKNQSGFISLAKNAAEDSRYEGNAVKKVDKETYFIDEGIYTTCPSDTPHTHFSAEEMKVIHQDRIFAKWIFMYVGGVPLPLPIPFAVFPAKSGRRSGIIVPAYGSSPTRGQYFSNFGYFFALSDYMDLALTGDYYSKGGFAAKSRFRYAERYKLNGNFNAEYSFYKEGEESDPNAVRRKDYNLQWAHSQTFNPTTTLDVNMQFVSSSFLSTNSVDYDNLLRTDIISNANFRKRWDESGNSLSLSYSRSQNLKTGNINETLPSLNFNVPTSFPFRKGRNISKDQNWYEYIGYSYSGQLRNNRNKTDGNLKVRGGIQHNISVNASPKIGYFNISPRINYTEKWYNKKIRRSEVLIADTTQQSGYRSTTVDEDIHDINFVRSFDFGISASTKIYGIMQPNMLGIEAFRHTVQPSISYNYRPDFSEEHWGYWTTYTNSAGEEVKYDQYGKEIFGGAGSGESQRISFSIGNIFEMKTMKDPTDTTSQSEKIQLLNLGISSGYDFTRDSLKLDDLRLTYRTQIGDILSLNGSSVYSFYEHNGNNFINRFLASDNRGLFRLTSFSFSASLNLSGDKIKGEDRTGETEEEEYESFKQSKYVALYDETEPPDFSIPWNLSLNYNFNLNKSDAANATKNSGLGLSFDFSLTKNWRFKVRGNYDFQRKEISAPDVAVYRDLHCWEMNFTWKPFGTYRGFRLEIRMKAPELRDIKVTKSRGLYTGRR